jgi:DNA-binding NarL/FixJ family response regulator
MEEQRIRVLLVEDHKLFADVMLSTLEGLGMEVVGVVDKAADALATARRCLPELVLVDIGLPDESGLSLGKKIAERLPASKVVALTAVSDHHAVSTAIRLGFGGFISKDTPVKQFIASIRAVLEGQVVVPPRLAREAVGWRDQEGRAAALLIEQLTERERQVLQLLAEGAGSPEIARRLSVSPNTVRTHIQNILTKLQVHSRLEAAAFAVRHGVVKVPGGRMRL